MKRLSVLGSTGSIGMQALEVVRAHPEAFEVVAMAAGRRLDLFAQQVREFRPHLVSVASRDGAQELQERLRGLPVKICFGEEGLSEVAAYSDAELTLLAVVGATGLKPALAAIRAGKDVALATKEALVMAGALLTAEAAARGVKLLPVDSEHSAIFQCLEGGGSGALKRIILTASGGALRQVPRDRLAFVTPEEALNHPVWSMGKKITIDSATLMNKGLEVIEARWLFDIDAKQVDVILHPQSIVHSLIEYVDGSVLAQLAPPDMRLPILYALSYPARLKNAFPSLDLVQVASLTFEPVDRERFRCLGYAYEAVAMGGTAPAVLNAANEVAVELFLGRQIGFGEIPEVIEASLRGHRPGDGDSLEEILAADREVREELSRTYRARGRPVS
ncbi:MAG TPA: 1-deoxy-D-xylulose-5-phosphate reductoisomerase [Candidatus Methylomirabilis sp.]|nr:1-deoxy-D-xylulose-5-phosphate reductoisomerase [Candidatus Methylomirabilis sp.]